MIDLYFQPYGDEQQLNLNWIINEIINLHKQLDPDYETPSFTQVYPYSNLNRLNLDWILSELKALKELAPEPTPELDIQAVAEALVALPFDSNTSYQIYDFISRDGEIWRATEAIPAGGVWDSSKWFKTKIGTDLSVLERWINTINNSLTAEIQARQDADTALQNVINGLTSADITDDSDAGGATVKASLNLLKGSLNNEVIVRQNNDTAIEKGLAIIVDGDSCDIAVPSEGYAYIKNNTHDLAEGLYKNKSPSAFPTSGGTANSTVFEAVSSGGLNVLNKKWQKILDVTAQGTAINAIIPDGFEETCIISYEVGSTIYIPVSLLRDTPNKYYQTAIISGSDTLFFAVQVNSTGTGFSYIVTRKNNIDIDSNMRIYAK